PTCPTRPTRPTTYPTSLDLERLSAVTERLHRNADLVEHRQQKVRHRCVIRILEVTAALMLARCTANDEVWQREMIVHVAVAHVAAEEQQRMVEQRAVPIRNGPQLLQ